MKRYCQTLELINDSCLLRKFEEECQKIEPEVVNGIKQAGILNLQIFRYENRLFMIIDTPDDFEWEKNMARLALLPRQKEAKANVTRYQKINPRTNSTENWERINKIFDLEQN